jgi:peptidoglycan hydrolase-like protein with peptidoglycan-binding domain
MSRIAERIIANPAMSGGLCVMALTAAAVISNALFLQRAHHPEPWFATRPAPVALAPGSIDVVVPDPRPRATPRVEPPMPRVQPVSATPAPEPAASSLGPTLIADLQRALSERGLYRGKIDGISGSRTRAAISAYEKSQGLPVTGQPSPIILDHIVTASIAPAAPAQPEPAPVAAPPAAVATPVAPPPAVAVTPVDPLEAEILSYPPKPAEAAPPAVTQATAPATPPPATTVAASAAPAIDAGAQRTLSVQKALNLIGYGPVPEDGIASEATVGAIRRFELDHGLPITGAAGDTVINRLVAIGAMEAA